MTQRARFSSACPTGVIEGGAVEQPCAVIAWRSDDNPDRFIFTREFLVYQGIPGNSHCKKGRSGDERQAEKLDRTDWDRG